jgi:hypothetical protein
LLAKVRARLNPPVTVAHDSGDVFQWTRILTPKAAWLTFLGFWVYAGVILGVPLYLWGIDNRAELLLLALYWPPAWHFYMRHHYKPEYRHGEGAEVTGKRRGEGDSTN